MCISNIWRQRHHSTPFTRDKGNCTINFRTITKDGFEFLYTKPVLKNSKPKKIKEIKRNNVRLLYFVADNTTYITNIISNKQKNKLEKQDKELAEQRMKRMLQMPLIYCKRV